MVTIPPPLQVLTTHFVCSPTWEMGKEILSVGVIAMVTVTSVYCLLHCNDCVYGDCDYVYGDYVTVW